ncbi:MAG: EAL domain-containing protein, partial [Gammaproteobacteria bacterium]|nr:EAL domain-containing protein [Gammaproteobacteria bacterium]
RKTRDASCVDRASPEERSSGWPDRLQAALAEHRIRAAYQPIIALADGAIVAEEALARFVATDGAVTPAGAFMEAAAACDLITAIDETVLNQTLARCSARRTLGLPGRLHFVNVSTALLAAPERLTHLAAAAEGCGTPWPQDDPRWRSLVIEITERELITDHSGVIRALAPLLEAGVRLALDDFGSGFSSFLYLADLPITFLKIEQALIARVGQDRRINTMVGALARMAADLDIITIAEGIETAATAASVAALGISWGQGYHFGRPGWE